MSGPTREQLVPTPHGEGRLVVSTARGARATLLLGHGAGAGVGTADLEALADRLPREGITVVRFEQPWVRAGRRVAPAGPALDASFVAGANRLRTRTPLVVGGRSAGARTAVRQARALAAAAVVALAFPLHPPGRPERSRLPELRGAGRPTLVVQGERDRLGRPEEFPPDVDLVAVPAADHSFVVPARGPLTAEQTLDLVVTTVRDWVLDRVAADRTGNAPGR